jgi:DNA-binding transcriptional MerR regulator
LNRKTSKNQEPKRQTQIGEAARKAGVSKQSLQYYLMVGLLEPTSVTPSGRRMFDDAAVERIRLIQKLNQSGYPLRAIRELFMEREKPVQGKR